MLEGIFGFGGTNFWQAVPDAPSVLGARYAIYRGATNAAEFYRLATRGILGQATPPDPASNAPPLAPNTFNDLGSSTAFLYTGSNAVQIGMAPGTIAPARAAVVRGKVKRRDNTPLAGVRVAIVNHPEYGYTFTRLDGVFDLAVNGGLYTVDFQAIGYCPAHRQVEAPLQDFRTVPDLVLVPLDPVTTQVSFSPNAPPQMAAGSPQTDAEGTRTTRVFLPAGTTASLLMPDGSTQPVSGLTLRMTEFTVGTNGHKAMPAELPPTSAYTFCAEFSANEAVNMGAKTVQFNQPVWGYVENFLNVPVGMVVPNGYYDRERAAWVPSLNGSVLKILGVTNGLAQVDLTGSNVVADATALADASFTAAELQQLAATYSPGQSIWRVPLSHLTGWDWNWAFQIVRQFIYTNLPGDKPQVNPKDTTPPRYGAVNLSSQVFEESVPLVGVPMALNYSSARVPDYRVAAKAVVPTLPPPAPPDIFGVDVQVEVAGKYTDIQNAPLDFVTISWDGYDVYGRYLGGTRQAHVVIAVEAFPDYAGWDIVSMLQNLLVSLPLFGSFGDAAFAGGHGLQGGHTLYTVGATFNRLLTIPDHRTIGLGGWSLTPHHSYDPVSHFLYLGDGTVLKQDRFGDSMGPMQVPDVNKFLKVAAGPDGTLYFQAYFNSSYGSRLCKLGTDGQFAFLSGPSYDLSVIYVGTEPGFAQADGKPALQAYVDLVGDMTVGPDGSLYYRDQAYGSIGRINPQGILHRVLGVGPLVYPPDGSLARDARSQSTDATGHIAVGRDGTVYYDNFWNTGCLPGDYGCGTNFIRKVAPDGRVYTVAGQGGALLAEAFLSPTNGWRSQMGLKAHEALLTPIRAMAVGPVDGTLYVSPVAAGYGVGGIYKITPDGTLGMVMNAVPLPSAGLEPYGDDGTNAATFAPYYGTLGGPNVLQAAQDGSVTFAENYAGVPSVSVIWRITPGGILQRLAGRGTGTSVSFPDQPSQQGANPLQVAFVSFWLDFAVGPDGSLAVVNSAGNAYHIGAAAAGYTGPGQQLQFPSEDASELYVFDARGLHLRTLNTLTGSTNWSFAYDANNLVTQLRDGNGLTTTVERDASGLPTGIVGPYGQRTTLSLDANGFLAAISNPVREVTRLTNSPGGLPLSVTGPLNDTYTVAYDADGLATQVRDPLGGGQDLASTNLGTEVITTSTTTLGNVDKRDLLLLPSGTTVRNNLFPDGTSTVESLAASGFQTFTNNNGLGGCMDFGGGPRFPTGTRLPTLLDMAISPGGPEDKLTLTYSATLSDTNNPFSVTALTNQTTVNGQRSLATYDGTNRVWLCTSPEGRQAMVKLDGQGRPIRSQTSGHAAVDILYDSQGRVIEIQQTAAVGLRRATLSYDSLGQLATLTDPLGRTKQYSYDGAGRLQQLTLADGQAANFQSDAEFHLTSVTPPGRPAHRFEHNAVGLVTNYVPPAVNGLDESVHYAYDADGNLMQVSLPDGQNVLFTRGPGGRIDQLVLGTGPTLSYAYGQGPASGLATNIVSTTGDSLHLDYQGPFTTNITWSGAITGSLSLTLNADFLPASQSVNGAAISYSYDRDLLLTQAGNLTLTNDPASGFITGTSLGIVSDQRRFDDRGLLTNYVASVSGTPVWSVALAYDLVDRLTNKSETVGGTKRNFSYAYDVAGRLQQVWQDGALAATYTYDANGNRLTRNAETAAYDAQDRAQACAAPPLAGRATAPSPASPPQGKRRPTPTTCEAP